MKRKKIVRAGALRFRSDQDQAPRMVAKGSGTLAEQMIAVAQRAGTLVVEDPGLCEVLSELPVGREVPENLYRVMAGLFALVYDLNQKNAES